MITSGSPGLHKAVVVVASLVFVFDRFRLIIITEGQAISHFIKGVANSARDTVVTIVSVQNPACRSPLWHL